MGKFSRREFLGSAAVVSGIGLTGLAKALQGFELPKRPDVLIPTLPKKVSNTERVGISMKTHEAHQKLWQGYARKVNEIHSLLSQRVANPGNANQIFSELRSLKVDYTFAYQGLINHNIYFDTIGGTGGSPTGKVAELISSAYGSVENWSLDFRATGIAARGWVYLAYDHEMKQVFNYIGDAQNSFPIWNHTCILAMDVYEHAYFLDFQEKRASYIDAYLKVIDWDAVNRRLNLLQP